ncbi:MAG TPA: YCF48-related protein [Pyrinomonadaceae bacterium]|nr:YCF48-related protein [Pyrinomonadaceae bacterium]
MRSSKQHRKTGPAWFRFIFAGIFLAVASPVLSQQGWVATRVGPPGQDLNTVFFLDHKRGWVGGDKGFLSRTDDGGHSWIQQIVETTDAINDIYFRDKDDGFLIAGNAIFVTRDNGSRWSNVRRFLRAEFDGADVELYSVRFTNKKKGWVVGSVSKDDRVIDSILLTTENAGETWQRQRAPSRLELIHLDFANEKRGWIVGTGGTILATTDGGQTWNKQESGTSATIFHIDFRSDKKGLAVGERGAVLRTSDGGATWAPVEVATKSTLLNVQFVDDNTGWAVGRGGTVLRSGNGGVTWISQESGTRQNLYGLIFVKKIGWAVGGEGTLLRYEQ